MEEASRQPVLEYESVRPDPLLPSRAVVAIVLTAFWSFFGILACFVVVQGDGPVFPLTVIVAPLWILVELNILGSDGVIFASLLIGGPALCATYAAIIVKSGRHQAIAITIVALFHMACFLYVCYLRGVWSLF